MELTPKMRDSGLKIAAKIENWRDADFCHWQHLSSKVSLVRHAVVAMVMGFMVSVPYAVSAESLAMTEMTEMTKMTVYPETFCCI